MATLIQTLSVVLYLLAVAIPIGRVLRRTGYSPWMAVMAVVPLLNLVALWAYAYSDWPIDEQAKVKAIEEANRWSEADKEQFRRLKEPLIREAGPPQKLAIAQRPNATWSRLEKRFALIVKNRPASPIRSPWPCVAPFGGHMAGLVSPIPRTIPSQYPRGPSRGCLHGLLLRPPSGRRNHRYHPSKH